MRKLVIFLFVNLVISLQTTFHGYPYVITALVCLPSNIWQNLMS